MGRHSLHIVQIYADRNIKGKYKKKTIIIMFYLLKLTNSQFWKIIPGYVLFLEYLNKI